MKVKRKNDARGKNQGVPECDHGLLQGRFIPECEHGLLEGRFIPECEYGLIEGRLFPIIFIIVTHRISVGLEAIIFKGLLGHLSEISE